MSELTFLRALSLMFGTIAFLGSLRFAYSYIALRQQRKLDRVPDRIEERLARIEMGIDAMAVEIERISEANRFMAKVLSEPMGKAVPARVERVITPH